MLPSKNRLTEFFRSQNFVSGSELRIFFRNNGLESSRFGISIQSGVLKKAVARNRCKRLIREWLRISLPHIKTGIDFWILVASVREEDLSSSDFFNKTLSTIFKRGHLFVSD
ncbi:MAG: ribonuclease P protein component [Candidatus Brennerbacteria bacterium RIFOXYC1_FULL_41_11]|uniref:Ribonuclease P protein component n=1 Tax=Candidatus Brennerbacteria bacterium RIFOXYD1_FULL_41_16 TaxID=1797529 RepID=A0A1G1XKY0_9BACT|nr:MAG: ribonuclease P protein component [Candidatus Brennerbacteria bacterium RIFOXYB1_FULL_41_13]OGY40125.1 MAG: ribonuclease P protein component [Candidatus Brennerbacteria bacterium RIFOXYC1_FULL_41_11]OGY40689.1 MAG: ribonuclease P protein component [Candidatus Brennerbacteria bacterium RIFOXYD1_FULL_41_16]